MYKLKLLEDWRTSKAGDFIQTKNEKLAKELVDDNKAELLRGKFKQVKTKKKQKDGTN